MAVQALLQAEEFFQLVIAKTPHLMVSPEDVQALQFMFMRAQAYSAVAHNQGWPVATVR
jgi:hypothetical protein